MPQKILTCVVYDESTETCTTQVWVDQPGLLPALSIEGAYVIGLNIALVWAIAYTFRLLKKALNT